MNPARIAAATIRFDQQQRDPIPTPMGDHVDDPDLDVDHDIELVTPIRSEFALPPAHMADSTAPLILADLGVSIGSSSLMSSAYSDGFDPKLLSSSAASSSCRAMDLDPTSMSARHLPMQHPDPLGPDTSTEHIVDTAASSSRNKLVLESPFKSPGWRMRELRKMRMTAASTTDATRDAEGEDEEGSMTDGDEGEEVLNMEMDVDHDEREERGICGSRGVMESTAEYGRNTRSDQGLPSLSKTLSNFSISRPTVRSTSTSNTDPRSSTNQHILHYLHPDDVPVPDSPSPAMNALKDEARVRSRTGESMIAVLGGDDVGLTDQAIGRGMTRPALRARTSTAPASFFRLGEGVKRWGCAERGAQQQGMNLEIEANSSASPISPTPGPSGAASTYLLPTTTYMHPSISASLASYATPQGRPHSHADLAAVGLQPNDSLSPREWERARSKTTPPRWTSRFGADGLDGMDGSDCAPEWVQYGTTRHLASPFSSGGPNTKRRNHARQSDGHGYTDSFSYAYMSGNGRVGADGLPTHGGGLGVNGLGMQYPAHGTSVNLDVGIVPLETSLTAATEVAIDEARERVERWARETYPQISIPALTSEEMNQEDTDVGRAGSALPAQERPALSISTTHGSRPNALAAFASSGSFVSIGSSSTSSAFGLGIAHRGSPSPSPLAGHASGLLGARTLEAARNGGPAAAFSPARKSPLRHSRGTSGNSSIGGGGVQYSVEQPVAVAGSAQLHGSPTGPTTRKALHPIPVQPNFHTHDRPRNRKRGGSVKSPDLEQGPINGMGLGYFDMLGDQGGSSDGSVEPFEGTSFEETGTGLIKTARIRSATTPHAVRSLIEDEASSSIQGRKLFQHVRTRSRTSAPVHATTSRGLSRRPPSPSVSVISDGVDMIENLDSPKQATSRTDQASPILSRSSSWSRNSKSMSEPSPFAAASAMVSESGSPISRKKSSLPLRLDAGPSVLTTDANVISLNSPEVDQLGFMPRSPSDPVLNVARPLFWRKITDPIGSRPGTPTGLSFATISDSSGKKAAWRKSFHSGLDQQLTSDRMSTPVQAFEMERPSPAAFMSTGLVKKGSGYLNHSASSLTASSAPPGSGVKRARSITLHRDICRTPDTPVKANLGKPHKVLELPPPKMKIHPLRFGESSVPVVASLRTPFDTAARSSPPTDSYLVSANIGESRAGPVAPGLRSRGLRRKGSRMWQRTDSGNYSNGSTIGDGFSFEEEPETPTRPENAGVVKLDFSTHTPSPPIIVHNYPFANVGSETNTAFATRKDLADSPSPPRKNTLLSRLQYSGKHRALARISNPLLNAAYKLGEQQTSRKNSLKATANTVDRATPPRSASVSPQNVVFERDFTLLEPLGQGEFSTVWKVKDKKDGLMYAVKRNKAFIGERDRLRQWEEVNIMRLLSVTQNQHIMLFHDAWEEKQQLHIKIGLAECGDLSAYLERIADDGGLEEARVWKLLVELASGLRHIHSMEILHLDLKPSNILLDSDGSVRIADFGLSTKLSVMSSPAIDRVARAYNDGSAVSKDSIREGDREYMSPETLHGHFSKAADVYNLGITILESAINVVLPSNGEAWQKLRSDDFSDLDEHLRPSRPLLSELSTQSIGNIPSLSSTTFGTSVSSTGSMSTNDHGGPLISDTLVHLVKRMMASDPLQRFTMDQVWHHPVIQRIRLGEMDAINVRTSTDSQSRASTDGWDSWTRPRGHGGVMACIWSGESDVKPALVPEGDGFLEAILSA